jgi:hypothetical protein
MNFIPQVGVVGAVKFGLRNSDISAEIIICHSPLVRISLQPTKNH